MAQDALACMAEKQRATEIARGGSSGAVRARLGHARYPLGKLADNKEHRKLLMVDISVLIAADLVLAHESHWTTVLLGATLWGLHMGLTQGLSATMVADTAPVDFRSTAFGFFNLLNGVAMLAASTVAGLMWGSLGAAATFYSGAILSLVTLGLLAVRGRDLKLRNKSE